MGKSLGKVLDISYAQGFLTQEAVNKIKEQGILGVILRIGFTGYGKAVPTIDKCFEHNYKLLHDNGINCGAYYFTLAYNEKIANDEIEFLKKELAKKVFEYPIYIDVENIYPKDPTVHSNSWNACNASTRTSNVYKICKALEDDGYYVGIYASKGYFGSKLLESPLREFDKWIAQYNLVCTYKGSYGMWQRTSSGKASLYGIYTKEDRVDVSEAYYDFPSIITSKGLNNYTSRKFVVCPKCGERIYID